MVEKVKTCSVCKEEVENPLGSAYGEICSRKCFDKLCDDILNLNRNDFNNEENSIEGEVTVKVVDAYDWYFTYGDVEGEKEDLTDILEEYKGKKVIVTIEEIE